MMTTNRLIASALAAAGFLASAGAACAHHAFNMFDNDKYTSLTGTVKTFTWKNPHAMMTLETAGPNGAPITWTVELSAPNIIGRRGWTKTSLKPGDKVPLVIHPMKDGSLYGLMVSVTDPAGKVLKDKA